MKKMTACTDCEFYMGGLSCRHPLLATPNVIYGLVSVRADDERAIGGRCGPEARHFHAYRRLWEVVLGLRKVVA